MARRAESRVRSWGDNHRERDEVMSDELLLAGLVRDWCDHVVPDQPALASHATRLALRCYAGGASAPEAFAQARAFLRQWRRGPGPWVPVPSAEPATSG